VGDEIAMENSLYMGTQTRRDYHEKKKILTSRRVLLPHLGNSISYVSSDINGCTEENSMDLQSDGPREMD